jgi:hypothetical protein
MKDLFFFICFIVIFLCGFSITSWSLINAASQVKWIYSDDGQLLNVTVTLVGSNSSTWQMFRDITHYGVWKVFGQVDPIGKYYSCDRRHSKFHFSVEDKEMYHSNFLKESIARPKLVLKEEKRE